MKHSDVYRRAVIGGVVLTVVFFVAWGMTREPATERLAREVAARRLIRMWELPRTRKFRQLFRQGLSEPVRPVLDFDHLFAGSKGPEEDPAPFSRRYSHQALWEGGGLDIGVFTEDAVARTQLRSWLERDAHALPEGLRLHVGKTRSEFLDALARCDMVLFFGHANLGRGLQLGNTGELEHWLAMAPEVIEMHRSDLRPGETPVAERPGGWVQIRAGHAPELEAIDVRCKILWLLGCRTEDYYRAWCAAHLPGIDLVTTQYNLDTTSYAVTTLQILVRALEERRPLGQVLDVMNRGRTLDLLRGMYAETLHRGLPSNPPLVLYSGDIPDSPPGSTRSNLSGILPSRDP